MIQTFANLPEAINEAIVGILGKQHMPDVILHAQKLHERYMTQDKGDKKAYIQDPDDVFAYLALRSPATYAQIFGAFAQVQEHVPGWQPKTMLDIGSGPGVGVWAAQTIWPSLEAATCLDQERSFLSLGKDISKTANLPVAMSWQQGNASYIIENDTTMYDIVLLGNILNELDIPQREHLIGSAFNHCKGIMIIVEPGTPSGNTIVSYAAKSLSHTQLVAPYSQNTFVQHDTQWIHFSQKFIRPEFQRRIRQHLRESDRMASDFEEAKYTYVAFGKDIIAQQLWGRCVGAPVLYKGYLEVPILTAQGLETIKVMKRHKPQYLFAKKLKWGESVQKKEDLLVTL